jgi:hypothetical protein
MRWTPMLAVLITPAAAALSIAGRAVGSDFIGTTGIGLILPCLIFLVLIAVFMPRPISGTPMDQLDEREIAIRQKVTASGYGFAGGFSIIVFAYMFIATEYQWWMPGHDDWMALMLLAICLFNGLPIALAHWAVRNPLEDEDDQ